MGSGPDGVLSVLRDEKEEGGGMKITGSRPLLAKFDTLQFGMNQPVFPGHRTEEINKGSVPI